MREGYFVLELFLREIESYISNTFVRSQAMLSWVISSRQTFTRITQLTIRSHSILLRPGLLATTTNTADNFAPGTSKAYYSWRWTATVRSIAHDVGDRDGAASSLRSSQSARSQFKEVPVNPSILKYIQDIGVGKPKRAQRRRIRRSRNTTAKADYSHSTPSKFLSSAEEEDLLPSRNRRRPNIVPPPPFPAPHINNKNGSNQTLQRLPVKLLGSVGSITEPFPRASPNLPEVVRLGRK